jgi:HSP20 family molecular chaperone IbpA
MQNAVSYNANAFIYPGSYVPLLNEDEMKEEIKRSFICESDLPTADLEELADSYKIEFSLPGLNREDFMIHADENILSICVCHKSSQLRFAENPEKKHFQFGLFDHHINLPADADAAFISAEYSLGILRFHIPKINQPVKNHHARIVVY